eukprot:TRINITY_DN23481_c0_g1_i5.p1 TRINITY_DN23481_c0_g1~~TRINITY_DN23481_c0_g1_i5.p1  ORF type:complete len:749 (+),score=42.49 TRINITY_DN23481_c0_g1_i5:426-2672(+)
MRQRQRSYMGPKVKDTGCGRYRKYQRYAMMAKCQSRSGAFRAKTRKIQDQNKSLQEMYLDKIIGEPELQDSDLDQQYDSRYFRFPQEQFEDSDLSDEDSDIKEDSKKDISQLNLYKRYNSQTSNNVEKTQKLQSSWQNLPDPYEVVLQPVTVITPFGTQKFGEGFDPDFVLINRSIMHAKTPEEVMDITHQARMLNGVNISTALYKIQDLLTQKVDRLQLINQQQVQNLVTHEIREFCLVYATTYSKFSIFRLQCVCNVLVSCATLRVAMPESVVIVYLRCVRQLLNKFTPKDLEDVTLSIAYMKLRTKLSQVVLIDIINRCIEIVNQFHPKEISVILWALASIQFKHNEVEQLCEVFALQLIRQRGQITKVSDLQVFSNAAWAFYQLGIEIKEVYRCLALLADSFRKNLEVYALDISEYRARVKIQAVSAFLWVLAKYDIYVTNFMVELTKQIPRMIELQQKNQSGQFVSNLLYGLAALSHYDQQSLNALTLYLCNNHKVFKPQEISNCIWALGNLGYECDEKTLSKLKDLVIQRLQKGKFTMVALGQLLFGFSTLKYMPIDLYYHLALYVQGRYIQQQHTYAYRQLLTNVYVAFMTMEALYDIRNIDFTELNEIILAGLQSWREQTQICLQSVSVINQEISQLLDNLGIQNVHKTMTRNGIIWIYICCLCEDQPTVIEVHRHGSDLTYNGDHYPMGMAKWRVWQLRARGWHVVEINGHDWSLLNQEEKYEFLGFELFQLNKQEDGQ